MAQEREGSRMTDRSADRTTDRTTREPGSSWNDESRWWRENWQSRPYVREGRRFEDYEPGYRYGFESASRQQGRSWDEAEPELRAGWDRYEHKGRSTWEEIKDSVRDAWEHLTGSDREHGRHDR